MLVYHYIEARKWSGIKRSGLEPRSGQRLNSGEPKTTYAFLEPAPREITHGPFPGLWDEFKGTRGDILVEVNIDQGDPNILVGDAGYVEGYLYREHKDELEVDSKYKISDEHEALVLYQKSLVTLREFLEQRPDYLLPEVQIRKTVTNEEGQLRLSETQPILDDETRGGIFLDVSLHPLPDIIKLGAELEPWLNSLGEKGNSLRESLRRLEEDTCRQEDYPSSK